MLTMKSNTHAALLCHTNDRQNKAIAASLQQHDPTHHKSGQPTMPTTKSNTHAALLCHTNDHQNNAITASLQQHDPAHHKSGQPTMPTSDEVKHSLRSSVLYNQTTAKTKPSQPLYNNMTLPITSSIQKLGFPTCPNTIDRHQ